MARYATWKPTADLAIQVSPESTFVSRGDWPRLEKPSRIRVHRQVYEVFTHSDRWASAAILRWAWIYGAVEGRSVPVSMKTPFPLFIGSHQLGKTGRMPRGAAFAGAGPEPQAVRALQALRHQRLRYEPWQLTGWGNSGDCAAMPRSWFSEGEPMAHNVGVSGVRWNAQVRIRVGTARNRSCAGTDLREAGS